MRYLTYSARLVLIPLGGSVSVPPRSRVSIPAPLQPVNQRDAPSSLQADWEQEPIFRATNCLTSLSPVTPEELQTLTMGSLPRETVLHELLQHESFPQAAVLHEPAPAWVPSMGCSPSGTDCSSVGPPQGHKSCQQTCSSVGSSLHGPTGPARSLLQHRLPMGSQPPSGIHLLQRGVLHGLQADISSPCPPLLKYVIPEELPLSLMGSALASSRSVLEPAALALSDMGWKRLLRSSSPTVNLALPSPTLNHVPKHHIYTSFKYLQEW
ncbi:hypothetical protein QYF61_024643 [Mycteria americana]|uniref:Uncharacterized protein n=1 Tax=Mycteria americana TaxID=33587 RepID=A0AAN7NMG8_MYCAM|nr:hypothetical protein QYF61_024643 [Mycteria americana]